MKRVFCLLLAVVLVCSLSACAGQSEEEERIVRVVTRMLTCPDEELTELLLNHTMIPGVGDEEAQTASLKAQETYAEHLKTVFTAEDLTEEWQTKFCGEGYLAMSFPWSCVIMSAHVQETAVSVESVEVELVSESNRTYEYTAVLIVTKGEEEIPFTQTGKMQLSEDGRISWIDLYAFNELTMKLNE